MAHFAQIDENNKVINVIVIGDSDCQDATGVEHESIGEQYCKNLFGGVWKKTSYNTYIGRHVSGGVPLRGNFAAIGYTYDPEHDVFYPPQPFPSWTISGPTWQWIAPVPKPDSGPEMNLYAWNEETKTWDFTIAMHGNVAAS